MAGEPSVDKDISGYLYSSRRTSRIVGSARRISSIVCNSLSLAAIFPVPINRCPMEHFFSTIIRHSPSSLFVLESSELPLSRLSGLSSRTVPPPSYPLPSLFCPSILFVNSIRADTIASRVFEECVLTARDSLFVLSFSALAT